MKQLQLKEVEKTVESIPMGQKAYFSKTVTEGMWPCSQESRAPLSRSA